ncbi:unnamed protein product [Rhizophagus irregularis]|nr:unnamed protein product [Rhizophagus irregularis]
MQTDEITTAESVSSTVVPSTTDEDIRRTIYDVIIQNDVKELTAILTDIVNFDVNKPLSEKEGDNKNALMIASSLDCYDIVKYLLTDNNIDINLQDNFGETALFLASALGNAKIVKLLLRNNANPNICNNENVTPLIVSSYNGHNDTVKALLEKGDVNINYQDNLCKTALSFAAHEGQPLIVELLLKNGADVNIADKLGWTPLMLAAYAGRANICKQLLIANANKNLKTSDNKTASIFAKDAGHFHIAEMIDKFVYHSNMVTYNYDEEIINVRKRDTHFLGNGNHDSRRISTASRLRTEMLPREGNTWWVYISWITTFFILDRFLIKYGNMNDKRVRQAWREKFTLCFIALLITIFMAFITFGFVSLSCSPTAPPIPLPLVDEFWGVNKKVMIVRGRIYNVGDFFNSGGHRPIIPFDDASLEPIIDQYYGKDVGELFPVNDQAIGCNKNSTVNGLSCRIDSDNRYHCHTSTNSFRTLESLFINRWLGDDEFTKSFLESLIGKDVTSDLSNIKDNNQKEIMKCFEHFQVGAVEGVTYGCASVTMAVIVVSSISTGAVIMKLISALAFDNLIAKKLVKKVITTDNVKDVIIMVPCYSEGYESMKASFDSLVATDYPDQNKILFIIADGNITGSGNDKSTPDILLDFIVPYNENFDNVRAKSYLSIGEGTKRHNMAKVYIGHYQYQNRNIPTLLIVKVGNQEERNYPKAGNRGKRDSQLVLMQMLHHAFNNGKMSPLEFDIFEKYRKLTQRTIDKCEFVMMVDADTIVKEDSVSNMVNYMLNDPSVTGLCGETRILNKTENWVTLIQVFEYYLSHHLGKSFEAVFASVTCLPGCFCMYRVFAYNYDGNRVPILVDENIMMNYSTNEVTTLHQQNLLLLGEDRYLTTLMLRAFPKRKTAYCPSAICETIAPAEFKVLVSQRRRWINGTIHNMFELLVTSELPGRFCFSMQFSVFLDIIGTFTSPFALLYVLYTLIGLVAGFPFQTAVIFSAISFSLQLILAIFTSFDPIIVMWFFIYLFSVPIWYIILPLYSFWNFDDFTWGATRKLNDDGTSSYSDTIFDKFDPKSVPFKKWEQWVKSTNSKGVSKSVSYKYI